MEVDSLTRLLPVCRLWNRWFGCRWWGHRWKMDADCCINCGEKER